MRDLPHLVAGAVEAHRGPLDDATFGAWRVGDAAARGARLGDESRGQVGIGREAHLLFWLGGEGGNGWSGAGGWGGVGG